MKPILLLFVTLACGYNVDTEFWLTLHSSKDMYLGYTVYLYHDSVSGESWLFAGAPKGNYTLPASQKFRQPSEHGIVYKCNLKEGTCTEMKPKEIGDEKGYISLLDMNILIKKQRGWFGSAMSIDRSNGVLTVCAPRTVVSIFKPFSNDYSDTMHGMCYSGKIGSTVLSIEYENLEFHNFRSHIWYNPLCGFSVHYASEAQDEGKKQKETHRIVGKPVHEIYGSVEILQNNKRLSIELPSAVLSQFGYSVESGYFFTKGQLLYVGGAPGWHYVGEVAIIDVTADSSIVVKLQGSSIGEYFGASLAVGDINNDGLDDLIVGAPYWGQDNGKVYCYFGSSKGQFEKAISFEGTVEGGHFGYAISSGDIDADGFDDIIVGAPWEESGVVYIYNGGSDLEKQKLQPSQRLTSMLYNNIPRLERFGFSTSKPIDIDGNGYLDIPIGAYKSNHATVLRSKPVVKTELVIRVVPSVLERDAKHFSIEVCPQYSGHNIESLRGIVSNITVTIDEQYKRTNGTFLQFKSTDFLAPCFTAQVNVSKSIRYFIEPISILVRHGFVNSTSEVFCKFCPVERRNNKLNVAQTFLPFNIGCGSDTVCTSNMSATAKFYSVRDNNTWAIGSTDVNLEVNLKNHGEPAYLAMLQFTIPNGIMLRSILPSCQEDTSKTNLLVACEVGNPLWKGDEKNITLDLDMKNLIYDSIHDHKLNFSITFTTRSRNVGIQNITKTLSLINEVSLSLNGKANAEAYYLSTIKDAASNISFKHTYQVYKLGATPIETAQLVVKVPVAINDSDPLIHIYKPQIQVLGQLFECFSEDSLLDNELPDMRREPPIDKLNMYNVTNKMQQIDNLKIKRSTNEASFELYDTKYNEILQFANESIISDLLYMNCSTLDVYCTTIVCNLNALKTLQDIGKVSINVVLNVEKLKDALAIDKAALKFGTEATVEILKPAVRVPINGTKSTMELVTMFYNTPKRAKLQLWIVVASVSVGVLLLIIVIAVLSMLGFFKRKGKQTNNEIPEETSKVLL